MVTPHYIVDIGMRMLSAREMFNAQGFDPSYIIDQALCGRIFTKTEQTRMCGNSVAPNLAEALCRANVGHLSRVKKSRMNGLIHDRGNQIAETLKGMKDGG